MLQGNMHTILFAIYFWTTFDTSTVFGCVDLADHNLKKKKKKWF